MIGTLLLLVFLVASSYTGSSLAMQLTPLTTDNHPCKPEAIKYQNRYICDAGGEVRCLAGWKEKDYNPDPLHPCPVPVCDPECNRETGECSEPNVCSCNVGWEGVDC